MQKNNMGFIKKLLGLEKKYVCNVCGKVFTNLRAFKIHEANHKMENSDN